MSKVKGILFYNPKSGRGRAEAHLNKFHSLLVNDCEVIAISGNNAEDAKENLRNALPGTTFLVVIGGDGLVNIAIQEIRGSDVILYVHPSGTGNDFAKHNFQKLRFNQETLAKFKSLISHEIDLGHVEISGKDLFYGQALSAGFDSFVNRRANTLRVLSGTFKYIFALLLELKSFKPIKYELEVDGRKISKEAMMVVVANGPTYGGGMKVLPGADVNDGFLDVMILNKVSKAKLLMLFPKVYTGSHVKHPEVELFKVQNISIDSTSPIYADGEFFGEGPLKISVKRNHLRILETN